MAILGSVPASRYASAAYIVLILLCLSGCNRSPAAKSQTPPSSESVPQDAAGSTAETRRMIERLEALSENADPSKVWDLNGRHAAMLRERLQATDSPPIGLQLAYARALLSAGNNSGSIEFIRENLVDSERPLEEQINDRNSAIFFLLGLAHFRQGERQNCRNNHTADSCILPLKKVAQHQIKSGSQNALEIFELLYRRRPTPTTRWLINLAHMTLGQHPDQVASEHLIDFPNWQREQKEFTAFRDIATEVGVAELGLAGGVSMEDFNGDDLLDIFVTSYGLTDQTKLFLNDGRGGFIDATEAAGLQGIVGGLNCIHADYDNDGDCDIFLLRGAWFGAAGCHPNSLLRNDGEGHFDDVTESAGLLTLHPTQTAVWSDLNRDGHLDLFIANESQLLDKHSCELFLAQGDGTFVEAADRVGLGNLQGFFKGVAAGDIDQDGWPDLYISDISGLNRLLRNDEGKFSDVATSAEVESPIYSFPTWFWDVDNDGDQDLFVCGFEFPAMADLSGDYALELMGKPVLSTTPRLYLNDGTGIFKDGSSDWQVNRTMFAMGGNFGDLDNDGNLDFYAGTGSPEFQSVVPNRMFRNTGNGAFEEVTSAGGFGHIQKGHGIAFGDIDGDGDQDIYTVMGGALDGDAFLNILYENPTVDQNWITLQLVGTTTNRSAIGSRLELTLDDGRKIYRSVGTGGSFGASSLQQEIGLGSATSVKRLNILWQNGPEQTFDDLEVNRKYRITEGRPEAEPIDQQYIPFRKKTVQQHAEQATLDGRDATSGGSGG